MLLERTLKSPLDNKEIEPVNPTGNQFWIFIESTVTLEVLWPPDAKKKLTQWKRPWGWERLKEGEGDDIGWDGWMTSSTQWTWTWVNSQSWWWKGKPGILKSMGMQRVRHFLATELNWLLLKVKLLRFWPPDGKELTHWKRPWCWERLKAKGEGSGRGWNG